MKAKQYKKSDIIYKLFILVSSVVICMQVYSIIDMQMTYDPRTISLQDKIINVASNIGYETGDIIFKTNTVTAILKDSENDYLSKGQIKLKINKYNPINDEVDYLVYISCHDKIAGSCLKIDMTNEQELILPIPEIVEQHKPDFMSVNLIESTREVNGTKEKGDTPETKLIGGVNIPIEIIEEAEKSEDYIFNKYTLSNDLVDLTKDKYILGLAQELRESTPYDANFIHYVYTKIIKLEYSNERAYGIDRPTAYYQDLDNVYLGGESYCMDNAYLIAVMLRSQGIPTKIVSGRDSTETTRGHAWNQVYMDGEWVDIDGTSNVTKYGDINEEFEIYNII